MPYPKIIIYNEEIELVEKPSDINDFLYGMSDSEKALIHLLEQDGNYYTLKGQPLKALSNDKLTRYVKHYLIREGQCCLSKITSLTTQDAFKLLQSQ